MRWLESLARLLSLFFYSRVGNLALDCIRGASWVTQLRMDWIKVFSKTGRPDLEIVQVRGRNDKLVDAEDGIEIFRFSQVPEISIDQAGHGHFTLIVKKDPAKHNPIMAGVKAAITEAFGPLAEIRRKIFRRVPAGIRIRPRWSYFSSMESAILPIGMMS